MDNSPHCVPALSVVITTWNRAGMVLDAIDSVLAQDCPDSLEIIVVDDGSTDGTSAVLQSLSERQLPESRFLHIVYGNHQGRTGAAQRGIDAASAPYVALLSSDDLWEPQRARELIAEERRTGGNTLIHTDWKEMDPTGKLIRTCQSDGFCRRSPLVYDRVSDGDGVLYEYVTSIFRRHSYPACTTMFPRRLFSGRYSMPDGMCTPDFWVALVGYLRCTVAYFDVTSLCRMVHVRQQHSLAAAGLWPELAREQVVTAEAINRLLADVVPSERSMIAAMNARLRLVVLREECREGRRLACLFGSLAMLRAAFMFPGLWPTIFCNTLLAISPRLHDAIRYGRPRKRPAQACS